MKTFEDRMHNLPSELFNEIYRLTFTASHQPVVIWKAYKPPITLQISRATREFTPMSQQLALTIVDRSAGSGAMLSTSYYSKTQTFIGTLPDVRRWLSSLAIDDFDKALLKIYLRASPLQISGKMPWEVQAVVFQKMNFAYSRPSRQQPSLGNVLVPVRLDVMRPGDGKNFVKLNTVRYVNGDDIQGISQGKWPEHGYALYTGGLHYNRPPAPNYREISRMYWAVTNADF